MQSLLPNTRQYFSYYHLTLCLEGTERYMGRVTHLQVIELGGETDQKGISHVVRFHAGGHHRELPGALRPGAEGELILDMGQGKSYRFKKHQC